MRGELETPRHILFSNDLFLRKQRLARNRVPHPVKIANIRKNRARGLRSKKRTEERTGRTLNKLREKRKLYKRLNKDILTNPKLLGGVALHQVTQKWAQETPKTRRMCFKERNILLKEQFKEYYKQTQKNKVTESIFGASRTINYGETLVIGSLNWRECWKTTKENI